MYIPVGQNNPWLPVNSSQEANSFAKLPKVEHAEFEGHVTDIEIVYFHNHPTAMTLTHH